MRKRRAVLLAVFLLPLEPLKCIRTSCCFYIQLTTAAHPPPNVQHVCTSGRRKNHQSFSVSHTAFIREYNEKAKGGRAVIRGVNCFDSDICLSTPGLSWFICLESGWRCNSQHDRCQKVRCQPFCCTFRTRTTPPPPPHPPPP